MSLLWIIRANYLEEYLIEIEFNSKEKGIIDFKNHLDKNIYKHLKKLENFKNFKLNS
ncbi:hypothetical protein [Flavobacterium sp.]|uniref:hypothetical protein n=1 Tax=Flavobacterium sp. TaxID=239 RepID=UPI0037519DD7